MNDAAPFGKVATLADVGSGEVESLLHRFGLAMRRSDRGAEIPGSYWGAPEAGIVGCTVHARDDTPLHSLLHETCHLVCMDHERRAALVRDAGGDDLEESAVCYLQVLLSSFIPGFGRARLFRDMDAWGYSFRLGSARRWFEDDAADARSWLEERRLVDRGGRPTFRMRGD